jgi:hypothetical protein
MFKCEECGCVFEKPKKKTEKVGEHFGFPAYEESLVSSCCEEGYIEVKECKICGEYSENDFCKDCEIKVKKKFDSFMQEFTEEEKELLQEWYDI